MTMIFSTWREASNLMTPLLVTLVMLVAPTEACWLLPTAILSFASLAVSYLPRRLRINTILRAYLPPLAERKSVDLLRLRAPHTGASDIAGASVAHLNF